MTSLRRALVGLGVLALLTGIGAATLILNSDHTDLPGLATALTLVAGWGFAFTGLYAWDRRPGNNLGPLMTLAGFAWFIPAMVASDQIVIFVLGGIFNPLPYAVLIHLLLSFPSGRLESRLQVFLAGSAYFLTTVMQAVLAPFTDPAEQGCEGCPENPLLVEGHSTLGGILSGFQLITAVILIAVAIAVVIRRWRRSEPEARRALGPIVFTGGLALAITMVQLGLNQADASKGAETIAFVASIIVYASMPPAFLVGLLRSRIGRAEEQTVALSAENRQLEAELRAKVEELRASRHRIVEAGYAERRRVERDLHDGAQQRLMALTMNLRLARDKLDSDPAATAELLDEALEELAAATAELRELARGIHPAVLTDRGLGAALEGLASRSPVPVEVLETPGERLPAPVELAAYFVVAEALTNVARYAEAERATVRIGRSNGVVEVAVRDDGVGGADPAAGTGLRGLEDRVAALDGALEVSSLAGEGTEIRARIPLAG
ncbi:MAG: sensor histidine kinase [Syntrophothermus sp.]